MAVSLIGAGGVIVLGAAPLVGYLIKRRSKYKVNCWFCNRNTEVGYEQRNSFMCPHCDQYNGFTEDGDYDRLIPGQYTQQMIASKRYCITPTTNANGLPSPSIRPQPARLCDRCNANMDEIRKLVGNFSPLNKNRFDAELAEYRYTLEQRYPLCPECTLLVHAKTEGDKVKYAGLWKIRNAIVQKVSETLIGQETQRKKKHRRYFMGGGRVCSVMHTMNFLLSITLFLVQFHTLQETFTEKMISLPSFLEPFAPLLVDQAVSLLVVALLCHTVAYKVNRCRVTLPDLLLPLVILFLLACCLVFPILGYSSNDIIAYRCAGTSSLVILASAVAFVPRKKKHKSRPNRVFHSAFSIASTPHSQSSSANSSYAQTTVGRLNNSKFVDLSISGDEGNDKDKENDSPPSILRRIISSSPAPSVVSAASSASRLTSLTAWRERERSLTPGLEGDRWEKIRQKRRENMPDNESLEEHMDWEDGSIQLSHHNSNSNKHVLLTRAMSTASPALSDGRRRNGRPLSAREETPTRELAPSLSGLCIRKDRLSVSAATAAANDGLKAPSIASLYTATHFSPHSPSRLSAANPFQNGRRPPSSHSRIRSLAISPARSTFARSTTPSFAPSRLTHYTKRRPQTSRLMYDTDDESCFTSVSQQSPQIDNNRMFGILIALVVLLLLSQLAIVIWFISNNAKTNETAQENYQANPSHDKIEL